MKRCPICGRTYTDDTLNFCLDDGALLSTRDDPHQTLRIPAPNEIAPTELFIPETQPSLSQVELNIYFPGTSVLIDSKVEVFLDEEYIGIGSIKRGINLNVKTSIGKHSLRLKHTVFSNVRCNIAIPSSGKYKVNLRWDSWVGFEDSIDLHQERA